MAAKFLTCDFCLRCAPGYYGNPLLIGSTCKKCDCSGNSDPNLIFEDCDEVTGQCRNCLRNTTGFKCERCAPGYYGDARIAKNCAVCNCGGGPCDNVTGECLEEGFEPPTGMDCPTISCDKCIWDLIDDLRLAALSIEDSKSGLLSVSSGAAAHRHVNELNSTIFLLKVGSHVVPLAGSHAGLTGLLLELLSFLSSQSHGCITDGLLD
nr:laminin subunit alpha-4-like isoform X1 [Mirounga angustirostris]